MLIRLVLVLVAFLPSLAQAAAITTAQAGNWSSTSTWTGGVVPGNGDTVTVNHAVTVDVDTTVGASPGEADAVQAVLVNAGGLTLASGKTLTVRGDIHFNNSPFVMQAGSTLLFDSTAAAAPTTTNYRLRIGTAAGSQTSATFTANGTENSPASITSHTSGANGYIDTAGSTGSWNVTYLQFSRLGSVDHTDAITIRAASGQSVSVTHCVFNRFAGQIYVKTGLGGGDNFTWRFNTHTGNWAALDMRIELATATTGLRLLSNNWFDRSVQIDSTGSVTGWVLDSTRFAKFSFAGTGTIGSAVNTLLYSQVSVTGLFGTLTTVGTFTDTLVFSYAPVTAHTEGFFSSQFINLDGGFFENIWNVEDALELITPSVNTASAADIYVKRFIVGLSGDATKTSGGFIQLKGTKHTTMTAEHNTVAVGGTSAPLSIYTQSGGPQGGHQLKSVKSNIFFAAKGSSTPGVTYGVYQNRGIVKTGTASSSASNDTTHLVGVTGVPKGSAGSEVHGTGENSWVLLMTDNNESRSFAVGTPSNGTDILVDPPFSANTANRPYAFYPLDYITAADYNVMRNMDSGTLYTALNGVWGTKPGYFGYNQTDPSLIGVNDVTVDPQFADTTRNLAVWSIRGLGNAAATAWANATSYAEGDIRSRAVTGFYGGQTINYRCVAAHTSTAGLAPGGFTDTALNVTAGGITNATPVVVNSTAHGLSTGNRVMLRGVGVAALEGVWTITVIDANSFSLNNSYAVGAAGTSTGTIRHNWLNYWEPESLYELRRTMTQSAGYNAAATPANALAWLRDGYKPGNASVRMAHDNVAPTNGWAGAVAGVSQSGCGRLLLLGVGSC